MSVPDSLLDRFMGEPYNADEKPDPRGYCTSTDNGEHKPITLEQAVTLLSQDPTEAKPVRLTFCGEPVNIVVYRSLIGEYTVAHEHGVESHLTVDSALKSAADIVNRLDIEYVQ